MSDISILFYADSMNGAGERLWKAMEKHVSVENIEIYRSIKALSHRLDEPRENIIAAVILTTSREAFWEISNINERLQDIRIVLIVPDDEEDTIHRAHRLFPRFLSYVDSNFEDVGAVLSNILKNIHSRTRLPQSKAILSAPE